MGSCGFGWSEGRLEEFPSFHANFTFHEQLGKGSFGSVFIAEDKLSQETLAVKVQSARRMGEHTIKNEASTWRASSNHENVCRFLGMYQEADVFFAVMERCKSSMWDRLVDQPKWNFKGLIGDIQQMLEGLQYIHSLRVVHRDIKAENILLGGPEGRTLKIADFGLAIKVPSSGSLPCKVRGSAAYMAPEMLAREGYSFPADVWSFGVLCWVMLMGHFPCGTANMAAADMKNVVLEVEEEPVRVTNGLAQLAKDVEEQAKEVNMMKKWTEREVDMGGVTGLVPGGFHGSEAELAKCQTALFCYSARLEVLAFVQSCLQRKLSARHTTKSALKAPLFLPHHEWLVYEDVLVVNRKALKRPDPEAKEQAHAKEAEDRKNEKQERSDQKLERKDQKQERSDKQAEAKERRAKFKEEVKDSPIMGESSHGDRSQRLSPQAGDISPSAQEKLEAVVPRAEVKKSEVQQHQQREVKQRPSHDDEEDESEESEGSSEEMLHESLEDNYPQRSSSEEQSIDSVEQDQTISEEQEARPVPEEQKVKLNKDTDASSTFDRSGPPSPGASTPGTAAACGRKDEYSSGSSSSSAPSSQSSVGLSIHSGPGLFSVADANFDSSMNASEADSCCSVRLDEERPVAAAPSLEADRVPEQPDAPAAEVPELPDIPEVAPPPAEQAPQELHPVLPCECPPELE